MEKIQVFSITCFTNRFKHIVVREEVILKRTESTIVAGSNTFLLSEMNKPLAGFSFIFESKSMADDYIRINLENGIPVTLNNNGELIRLKL